MSVDKEQLVAGLAALSEVEAREVFNQARGQDITAKKQRAAQAIQKYLSGSTITVKGVNDQ